MTKAPAAAIPITPKAAAKSANTARAPKSRGDEATPKGESSKAAAKDFTALLKKARSVDRAREVESTVRKPLTKGPGKAVIPQPAPPLAEAEAPVAGDEATRRGDFERGTPSTRRTGTLSRTDRTSDPTDSASEAISTGLVGRESDRLKNRSGDRAEGRTAAAERATRGDSDADEGRAKRHVEAARTPGSEKVSRAPRIEVVDRRPEPVSGTRSRGGSKDEPRSAVRSAGARSSSESREPVVFRSGGEPRFAVAETDIELPSGGGPKSTDGAAAELARRLDAQDGQNIVRQVKVILNRADAGEIRINLRPENLGRVKVRIQLEENRLTGRIFVESAAAREAFRASLDGLQTRLVESGFGSADLELAWDEAGGRFADGRRGSRRQDVPDNAEGAHREFDAMVMTADESADGINGHVNMVV